MPTRCVTIQILARDVWSDVMARAPPTGEVQAHTLPKIELLDPTCCKARHRVMHSVASRQNFVFAGSP